MITLAIIAKDEVEKVVDIVNTYGQYFSDIVVAGDWRHEEFEKIDGIRYFRYVWKKDFADKRNFVADKVKTEYYFRLDTDDQIVGVGKIHSIVERAKQHGIDVVYMNYIYGHDVDGHVTAQHWREVIIRKREGVYWKKRVHENIFFDNPEDAVTVKDKSIVINHVVDTDHHIKSTTRNLEILLEEFNQDGDATDPRTLNYLGKTYLGLGEYDKAIYFLSRFINRSKWDSDIFYGKCHLSDAFQSVGKLKEALLMAFDAINDFPSLPDGYLRAGQVYLETGDFKEARDFFVLGLSRPVPDTMVVIDPSYYTVTSRLNYIMSMIGLKDYRGAYEDWKVLYATSPSNPAVISCGKVVCTALEADQFYRALSTVADVVAKNNGRTDLLPCMIPEKFADDSRFYALKTAFQVPVRWDRGTVAIFCGKAFEPWGPESLKTGIGGSEEATILMSQELAKLGYKVVVFNQPIKPGLVNGVEYRNWTEFNKNDIFDTIIFWRGVPCEVKARQRIVWLHDVPFNTLNRQNADWYDKVFVLSNYHKSLLPSCVDKDKVVVTSNGVNLEPVKKADAVNKVKGRCVYTSSYDRGLEELLDMWPEVRKAVPHAELHVCYGWETFDKMVERGMRDKSFKARMEPKLAQEGVVHHGRVGEDELAEIVTSSEVFAYPCKFEEISCISAMRAQACGTYLLSTDYAALSETNKYGCKVSSLVDFKERLIHLLSNGVPSVTKSTEWGWENVAKVWDKTLK